MSGENMSVSLLFTFAPTAAEVAALEEAVKAKLTDILIKKGVVKSPEEIAFRKIRPTDIGLANDVWAESIGTANAWNRITPADGQKIEDKAIAIFGVANLEADYLSTGIRLTKGAGRDLITLFEGFFEEMYLEEVPKALFKKVVYFEPEDYMNMYLYGRKTGTDRVILLGVVAEPKTKIISE